MAVVVPIGVDALIGAGELVAVGDRLVRNATDIWSGDREVGIGSLAEVLERPQHLFMVGVAPRQERDFFAQRIRVDIALAKFGVALGQ